MYKGVVSHLLDTKSWAQWLVVSGCLSHIGGPGSIPVEFVWADMRYAWLGAAKWASAGRKFVTTNQPRTLNCDKCLTR